MLMITLFIFNQDLWQKKLNTSKKYKLLISKQSLLKFPETAECSDIEVIEKAQKLWNKRRDEKTSRRKNDCACFR